MKKEVIKLIIWLISIYFILWLLLFVFQRSLIYFPTNQDFKNCYWFNDYQKLSHDSTRFYYKNISDEVIVYYHWNAWSACDRSYLRQILEKSNKSILFVEYAWYSNDNRSPKKKKLLSDAENVSNFLEENNYKNITVIWRSIWSWIASYHANIWQVDTLVLISPFTTFVDLVSSIYPFFPVRLLLTEKYDNLNYLSKYENELIIIHWKKDDIIPIKFWKKLYEKVNTENKKIIKINKWHNDLELDLKFFEKLWEYIK